MEVTSGAVAARFPRALIIGSDQVASCEGTVLDKPGSHANAVRQLTAMSGRTATFDTAVALCDAASGTMRAVVVPCRVRFRQLAAAQIEDYLQREQPYDCAGSAKAEGLGIALIERITGRKAIYDFGPEREGDHKVYISDLARFERDYGPANTYSLEQIFTEIVEELSAP